MLKVKHNEYIKQVNALPVTVTEKLFLITIFNDWFSLGCREQFYTVDDHIATEIGITSRQIRNIKRSLSSKGYISISVRTLNGKPHTYYNINFESIMNPQSKIEIKALQTVTLSQGITVPSIKNTSTTGDIIPSVAMAFSSIDREVKQEEKISTNTEINDTAAPAQDESGKIDFKGNFNPVDEIIFESNISIPFEKKMSKIADFTPYKEDGNLSNKSTETPELIKEINNINIKNKIDNTMNIYKNKKSNKTYTYDEMYSFYEREDIATINELQVCLADGLPSPTQYEDIDIVVLFNCMQYHSFETQYERDKKKGHFNADMLMAMQNYKYNSLYVMDERHKAYWDASLELLEEFNKNPRPLNYSNKQEFNEEIPTNAADIPNDIWDECRSIIIKRIPVKVTDEYGDEVDGWKEQIRGREEMKPLYNQYLKGGMYSKEYLKECFRLAYEDIKSDESIMENAA